MKNLGYTLHSILRRKEEIPPGRVEQFGETEFEDLLRLGAIRKPSEDELALFNLGKPKAAAEPSEDAPAKGKGGRGKKGKEPEAPADEDAASDTPSDDDNSTDETGDTDESLLA